MKVFNAATEAVKQGGTRRGANMGILRVDHPDIREFITCKQDNKDITNFNISVAVTEEFMAAVENGEEYDLIDPKTNKPVGRENAREIFDAIVSNAWNNGEPGIIFLDRLNKDNVTPELGEIESTNPCFHPDTFISTSMGLIKVKELYEKYRDREFEIIVDNRVSGETVRRNKREYMVNGVSRKKARVFKTGFRKTVKVVLDNGQEIKVTEDHRILTLDGWVEACNLNKGDHVLVQSGKGGFPETDSIGKDVGLFLGWITGDGWLTSVGDDIGLVFADDEYYLCEKMNGIAARIGAGVCKANRRENGTWQLFYKRKGFITKMRDYGVMPVKAPSKRVPKAIFKCSEETVKAYLNGLFSSDGAVNYVDENHKDIRLCSSSECLLKDVQLLLLNLGVFSSIYRREKKNQNEFIYTDVDGNKRTYTGGPYYELIINGDDMYDFSQIIGNLIHKEKNEKLKLAARVSRKKTKFISKVVSIKEDEQVDVYDISEGETHSLIAQGIVVHNCGEQPLLPYEACNLGSINLSIMLKNSVSKAEVDYDRLKAAVRKAVHFLDNVIDVNKYPLHEIDKMTRGTRKIGLGVMGWADMLCRLGIPYNSKEALELADKLMHFIQEESRKASIELAERKGVFPYYDKSIYKDIGVKVRNATTTTIAPTGTLSIIAGVSSGIEPLFAISYIRNVMDNDELVEVNPLFKQVAIERGFYSEDLMKRIAKRGTIKGFPEIPADVREVFVTAHDIEPEWHVKMQAVFQKYTDNAVSKTVNLPHEATKDDVKQVFMLAYKTCCKGVTIYRDGSRDMQVLNIGRVKGKEEKNDLQQSGGFAGRIAPRERPEITTGFTEKVKIGCGNLYITVNYDEYGICEVFTNTGRAGGCPSQSEATSRLVSIALRSGMDVKAIVEQLKGIRCPSTIRQKGLKVLSCPDAIGRLIQKVVKLQNGNGNGSDARAEIDDTPEDLDKSHIGPTASCTSQCGDCTMADSCMNPEKDDVNPAAISVCPDCGTEVEHEGGCVVCRNCGFSKCG